MTHFAPWLSPATMQVLALALLHFLWQGAALAALGYVLMALCRKASTRYTIGVFVLALMLVAPVCTFLVLQPQEQNRPALCDPATARHILSGSSKPGSLAYCC